MIKPIGECQIATFRTGHAREGRGTLGDTPAQHVSSSKSLNLLFWEHIGRLGQIKINIRIFFHFSPGLGAMLSHPSDVSQPLDFCDSMCPKHVSCER